MKTQHTSQVDPSVIGIDYHKRYSVYCVVDSRGDPVERGRIDHCRPEGFQELVRRWPGCRVVFEASMNWHWLYEILESELDVGDIELANFRGSTINERSEARLAKSRESSPANACLKFMTASRLDD